MGGLRGFGADDADYLNFTFRVVSSAETGIPSWILSFASSPCPIAWQCRMNLSQPGASSSRILLFGFDLVS